MNSHRAIFLSAFGLERERRVFAIVFGEVRITSASKSIIIESVRNTMLKDPIR